MADAAGSAQTAHVRGFAMKPCVIIPCFNHPTTIAAVAKAAREFCPVFIVDDGSSPPVPELPGCVMIRLEKNHGKGAALRAGFQRAIENGFTHAITLDADGQHFAEDLPKFLVAAETQPDALVVGIRNLREAGAIWHRQISNGISNFWFRVETGIRLRDTQCGFRCYPLELTRKLKTRSGRYAFELEFMVRAAWVGAPVVSVPVKCVYIDGIRNSHFRPVVDFARIAKMNVGLVLQSWIVPQTVRAARSLGKKQSIREIIVEIFSDHAHDPVRLALAVGIGLFCGIAPLWGIQSLTTVTLAHWLRLNKAIALLASNISIPPVIPFILYGELILGHWLCTGNQFNFSTHEISRKLIREYFGEWCVGSLVLAAVLAVAGMMATYSVARILRPK
ncbi:MAG TPA: DUF2062 domain-containing protein [Verrucomicrobiae bacterium]|nr:DUF2062 domain-containing protein [Verrucomicrobiae bacterium]